VCVSVSTNGLHMSSASQFTDVHYLSKSYSKMISHSYEDLLRGKNHTHINNLCFNSSKMCIFWLDTIPSLALSTWYHQQCTESKDTLRCKHQTLELVTWAPFVLAKFIFMPQLKCKLLHIVDLWGHLRDVKIMSDPSAHANGWVWL